MWQRLKIWDSRGLGYKDTGNKVTLYAVKWWNRNEKRFIQKKKKTLRQQLTLLIINHRHKIWQSLCFRCHLQLALILRIFLAAVCHEAWPQLWNSLIAKLFFPKVLGLYITLRRELCNNEITVLFTWGNSTVLKSQTCVRKKNCTVNVLFFFCFFKPNCDFNTAFQIKGKGRRAGDSSVSSSHFTKCSQYSVPEIKCMYRADSRHLHVENGKVKPYIFLIKNY